MNRNVRITLATVLGALIAVATLVGGGALLANTLSSHYVPDTINYQGYLTDSSGDPISSTVELTFSVWDASTGGSQVWSETHSSVPVVDGYFSVLLGSEGSPFDADDFKGTPRYVQVVYSGTTFPRQVFASVPYAMVSHYAVEAGEAISSTYATTATYAVDANEAITSTYAYTAAYAMSGGDSSSGVNWSHVVVVAKSGGDYTSLGAAISDISPSSSDRYLILVMPGVYEEQVTLPEYVHVKGAGVHSTIIQSNASDPNFNDAAAATLQIGGNTQLSDIAVYNNSTTDDGVAVRVASSGNESTMLNHVRLRTTGSGGDNHIGLYMTGSGAPKVNHVYAEVNGGTSRNWAMFINATKPVVENSTFIANGTLPAGLRTAGGSPVIKNSTFDGANGSDGDGIDTSGGGSHTIYIERSSIIGDDGGGSSIASNTNYDIFVATSQMEGDSDVFAPADITCVHTYDGEYTALNATCD